VASQEALAVDDYSEAGAALEKLASESTGDLKGLAQEAAQAPDIESMRLAFIPLSDEVAKADLPGGYLMAFCPMANNNQGANWIQKDGNLMNPYFGTAMQACGTIVK
jgi:Cu(I)/Ag(I) efflux system membrane fusion protein